MRPELTLQDFSRRITIRSIPRGSAAALLPANALRNSGCGGLRIANARGVPFEIRLAESPNNHSVTGVRTPSLSSSFVIPHC